MANWQGRIWIAAALLGLTACGNGGSAVETRDRSGDGSEAALTAAGAFGGIKAGSGKGQASSVSLRSANSRISSRASFCCRVDSWGARRLISMV